MNGLPPQSSAMGSHSESYIYDFAVAEDCRRQGIATALIGELQRIANERGASGGPGVRSNKVALIKTLEGPGFDPSFLLVFLTPFAALLD